MRAGLNSLGCFALLTLSACGGGTGTAGSPGDAGAHAVIAGNQTGGVKTTVVVPGTSVALAANATVAVPAGAVVTTPSHNTINLSGDFNTVNVEAGSVVTVPATATGAASNLVTAGPASTNGGNPGGGAGQASATLVAGSASMMAPAALDGKGGQAAFEALGQIALDADGNIIAVDRGRLRKITPGGAVSTLFGGRLMNWGCVAVDAQGNLYGIDASTEALQRVAPDGGTTTLNDSWKPAQMPADGGEALALDAAGNIYVADFAGRRVVKFRPDGAMSLLAGSGAKVGADGVGALASFHGPSALALDAHGNVFVNDTDTIRKIAADGTVSTLASIPARIIPVDGPLAIDGAGNLYTATENPSGILRVSPSGVVTTHPLAGQSLYILAMAANAKGELVVGTGWASPAQLLNVAF